MYGWRPYSLLLTGDIMKTTVKTALGGMLIAMSAAIMMMSSIIPFLTYSIPAITALFVMFMRIECDSKWAFAVYVGTSIVCAFVVPEKEAVAIYIALTGYYPLLKLALDKLNRVLSVIVKAVFFVAVIVSSYTVMMRVFSISTELLEETGRFMIPLLVVLGLVTFLLYDYAIGNLEIMYYRKWQKQVRKIIRKK